MSRIDRLWLAYEAAGECSRVPMVKEVRDLLDDAEEDGLFPAQEIPFDRWLHLVIKSQNIDCIENIQGITDDETEALYFVTDRDRLSTEAGKMQRIDVAAALFNNQLSFDKKHGWRMREKYIKGHALYKALHRAGKL